MNACTPPNDLWVRRLLVRPAKVEEATVTGLRPGDVLH
jgi:hypothetical protein